MTMKRKYPGLAAAAVLLCLCAGTSGQDPAAVMAVTRSVADKVLRETSFDYRLVPLDFNGGLNGFSLEKTGGNEIYYAFLRMGSSAEGAGLLGLSFSGRIRVFVNGEAVFTGSSPKLSIREYTYDRYHFQQKIPVRWAKGENRIMIKCLTGAGPVEVLLMPVDRQDMDPGTVTAVRPSEEAQGQGWLINGPWNVSPATTASASVSEKSPDAKNAAGPDKSPGSKNTAKSGEGSDPNPMERAYPPEPGFRNTYRDGDRIMTWSLAPVPMLRELVIPETSSYQRDPYADWHYANGGTLLGILSLFSVSGDSTYLDFTERWCRNLIDNQEYFRWQYKVLHAMRGSFHRLFRMTMLDDSGGPALPLAQLETMGSGQPGSREILDTVFRYVMKGQERLQDGTFSRPEPEPATVWADDLFMSVPFLLRMAEVTGNDRLYDEVARQVIQFNRVLSDPGSGLYFHGWYDGRKENTPVRWGRANGWIVWATSEALLHMPADHPAYAEILQIYRNHMDALVRVQDPSGMWHQVADHPETYPETSCTAMFTLALARGVRMGWLPGEYRLNALKGWKALKTKIRGDGTVVDICRGTGIGNSVEWYDGRQRFDHDPRGLGAVLTAGCEVYLMATEMPVQ
jgi:unsaturated rhamnogalacturonyl hydrolase